MREECKNRATFCKAKSLEGGILGPRIWVMLLRHWQSRGSSIISKVRAYFFLLQPSPISYDSWKIFPRHWVLMLGRFESFSIFVLLWKSLFLMHLVANLENSRGWLLSFAREIVIFSEVWIIPRRAGIIVRRVEVMSRINHRRSVFDRHVLGLSFFEHPLV